MQLSERTQKLMTDVVLRASAPWVMELRDVRKRDHMYNDINSSLSKFRQEHSEIVGISAALLHPHHVDVFGMMKAEGGAADTFSFRINLFDEDSEEDEITEDERVAAILDALAQHVPPDMYSCRDVGVTPCEDGTFIIVARFAPKGIG